LLIKVDELKKSAKDLLDFDVEIEVKRLKFS
jgi:hypothetical protein